MTSVSAGTVITGTLLMAVLAYKAIDFVKYIVALFGARARSVGGEKPKEARAEALNGLITLVLGGAVGIGVVMLMAHTLWSNQIKIGAFSLQALSAVDQVVLGLVITSVAAALFDVKKAIDGTETASTPKLLTGPDRARHEYVAADSREIEQLRAEVEREGAEILARLSQVIPNGDGSTYDARPLLKGLEELRVLKEHLQRERKDLEEYVQRERKDLEEIERELQGTGH
jgi:hypothetical protein